MHEAPINEENQYTKLGYRGAMFKTRTFCLPRPVSDQPTLDATKLYQKPRSQHSRNPSFMDPRTSVDLLCYLRSKVSYIAESCLVSILPTSQYPRFSRHTGTGSCQTIPCQDLPTVIPD